MMLGSAVEHNCFIEVRQYTILSVLIAEKRMYSCNVLINHHAPLHPF